MLDDSKVCSRVKCGDGETPVILEVRLFYDPNNPRPFVWYECTSLDQAMRKACEIKYDYHDDVGTPERIIDADGTEYDEEAIWDYWDEHGID